MDEMRQQPTARNGHARGVRLMLAMIFLMTGVLKLVVPSLSEAWWGQLVAAEIPFPQLARWTVPFIEMAIGALLAFGLFVRYASIVVTAIMVVATYVHVVVDDPGLFPLQPSEPVVPLLVILASTYLLFGGGERSNELVSNRSTS
jgi:uncharacterized membrane protein YphA (DoxX/SURF4 family)